jgi:transcriptional regulator with XRE-family HTH domain
MPKAEKTTLDPEWVRVGATLRTIREIRGWKPDQFASQIDISRPYLANIEAGRKKLTNVLLARAAMTLQVEQIAIMLPGQDPVAA